MILRSCSAEGALLAGALVVMTACSDTRDTGGLSMDGGIDSALSTTDASRTPGLDAGAGVATLTNATLFRADTTGTNLGSAGGHVDDEAWTTQSGAQNVPGNYVSHLFLAKVPNPTAVDFLDLTDVFTVGLPAGETTLYFFADGDDDRGGRAPDFGMNLWFSGAAASAPSTSMLVVPGDTTFAANASKGCTAAYDGQCTPAANTLSSGGTRKVTVKAFTIARSGGGPIDAGATPCVDKVGSDNHAAAIPNAPNGICDTVGTLTITVE